MEQCVLFIVFEQHDMKSRVSPKRALTPKLLLQMWHSWELPNAQSLSTLAFTRENLTACLTVSFHPQWLSKAKWHCWPEQFSVFVFPKFFTLLSSIRTHSHGLCPQGASVYPGRQTHRQPTNQGSECPALGGNTREEASCPGIIRTPFTDEILNHWIHSSENVPEKKKGKIL